MTSPLLKDGTAPTWLPAMMADPENDNRRAEALELMATDPIKYAIGPRFMAFAFSVPVLTLLANLFGVLGAFLVAVISTNTTPYSFLDSVLNYITMPDIWIGIFKAWCFGMATGCIACYNGYRVEGGAAQVGEAANQSVVYSIIALLVLNYCISTIVFGSGSGIQKF